MVAKRRKTNRRRQDWRQTLRQAEDRAMRWARMGGAALLLLLVGAGLPYGALMAYRYAVSSNYFAVRHIDIQGRRFMRNDQILGAAGLSLGMNIFDVEPDLVRARLEGMELVRSVSVDRRLPDRIYIQIDEFSAAALLIEDAHVVVDQQGVPFRTLGPDDLTPEVLALPLVTGLTRAELATELGRTRFRQALDVANAYTAMGLDRQFPISEVHADSVLGVSLVVGQEGMEIRLGSGRYPERLERLKKVLGALVEKDIPADYILLDQEEDLSRVAVGRRPEPGKGNPPGQ